MLGTYPVQLQREQPPGQRRVGQPPEENNLVHGSRSLPGGLQTSGDKQLTVENTVAALQGTPRPGPQEGLIPRAFSSHTPQGQAPGPSASFSSNLQAKQTQLREQLEQLEWLHLMQRGLSVRLQQHQQPVQLASHIPAGESTVAPAGSRHEQVVGRSVDPQESRRFPTGAMRSANVEVGTSARIASWQDAANVVELPLATKAEQSGDGFG